MSSLIPYLKCFKETPDRSPATDATYRTCAEMEHGAVHSAYVEMRELEGVRIVSDDTATGHEDYMAVPVVWVT